VGLKRGPPSLVSTIEELLERKSSGSSPENQEYCRRIRHSDHATPSIRKSWYQLSRQAGVIRSVQLARGLKSRSLV
jgi:hypothetical protein